jgi:UMF1 family MFS transporter
MTPPEAVVGWIRPGKSEYRRRIRAWTMYDWANSAFITSVLGAILPIYYSRVAGATLPSEATATAYWSLGLSISLLVIAIMAPVLGTISDITRGKKRFLAFFMGLGVVGTTLLVLVETGDWLLASIIFIIARIGFGSANVFYDALLPHVAREEDRDQVSARGYALGYLGGGILLAINAAMIQFLPGTWGPRLSFVSVAIWWAVFSIPILTRVPEPPTAGVSLAEGESVVSASFAQLRKLVKDVRQYRELFKYLVAFLIYNDGIGTIIGVGIIYGAELGFGTLELVLALLLIQIAGIPFALIFGRLPSPNEKRRAVYLAFIIFSLVAVPVVGIIGARVLPGELVGAPLPPYPDTASAVGEGTYRADDQALRYSGDWRTTFVSAEEQSAGPIGDILNRQTEDARYATTDVPDARCDFAFNGQQVKVLYSSGPDRGIWAVEMDGQPLVDENTGDSLTVDGYNPAVRYGVHQTFRAEEPGEHTLTLVNTGERNPDSQGTVMTLAQVEVLSPIRQNNLGVIFGLVVAVELVGVVFALLLGEVLFSRLAETMNTKRSIILSLIIFVMIAVWGFFLDSVIEFWFLSWSVSIVLGGSQALSRSLYASMSPSAKSGEFFGLYSVMSKFSAIIGPLLFAIVAGTLGSSRPAVLSLVAIFVVGGFLLTRVDIAEGRRVAQEENAAMLGAAGLA